MRDCNRLILQSIYALCLLTTRRAIARQHAHGLTARQIIDQFNTVKTM